MNKSMSGHAIFIKSHGLLLIYPQDQIGILMKFNKGHRYQGGEESALEASEILLNINAKQFYNLTFQEYTFIMENIIKH